MFRKVIHALYSVTPSKEILTILAELEKPVKTPNFECIKRVECFQGVAGT